MKSISLRLFAFVLGIMVLMSCSKSEDAAPSSQDVARTNLSKTWRLDINTVRVGGVPLNLLASTGAAIPDLSPIRLAIKADGTYTVTGAAQAAIAFLGFNPSGTWAFDGTRADRMIFNPGALPIDIQNLTTSSMGISYAVSLTGAPTNITATLLPAN